MSSPTNREPQSEPSRAERLIRIAPGVDVPYPTPTSAAATAIGKANRRRDTRAEVALRRVLHRRGLRFRVDHAIDVGLRRAVRVDIAFTRVGLAVFVDGCFWHGCPQHLHLPKRNQDYWLPKLQANVDRDQRVDDAFARTRWVTIRVWEHEGPEEAADRIQVAYRRLADAIGSRRCPRRGQRG